MIQELKKIDIWSLAKIVFLISLFIGFISSLLYAGLFFFMISIVSALAGEPASAVAPAGAMVLVIVFFGTVTLALFYTAIAILLAVLYNVIARWAGGIRFEFEPENPIHQDRKDPDFD